MIESLLAVLSTPHYIGLLFFLWAVYVIHRPEGDA